MVKELSGKAPLVFLSISDPSQPDKKGHFITCVPCSRPDVPVGRWTRTSIAYDVERQQHVILKDSWRVLLPGITSEGEIYKVFEHNKVPNIPRCLLAGNVGDDNFHSSMTHTFNDTYSSSYLSDYLVPHRHHRLVLDTIGRRLETFKCSWELVNAVRDALVGKFLCAIRRMLPDPRYSPRSCLQDWLPSSGYQHREHPNRRRPQIKQIKGYSD